VNCKAVKHAHNRDVVVSPVPARKMRVDVFDESGNRYTITLEGSVTRKSALRILDIVELLGGMPGVGPDGRYNQELSKFDRVRVVVERRFPLAWFAAKEIKSAYEKEISEKIGLSTVSTYLSRLADKGALMEVKNSNKVLYRLVAKDMGELARSPGT